MSGKSHAPLVLQDLLQENGLKKPGSMGSVQKKDAAADHMPQNETADAEHRVSMN
jgi:hypothetical protein